MKVLALDLGTKTGWALLEEGGVGAKPIVISGVQDFSLKRGESPGIRFLMFRNWLKNRMLSNKPDLIVYEQAHHRGGAATAVAYGLQAHLLSVCAELGVEFMPCHTGTLKKFATGRGNASKAEMVAVCKSRFGVEPLDDNEADAVCLAFWGLSQIKEENNG